MILRINAAIWIFKSLNQLRFSLFSCIFLKCSSNSSSDKFCQYIISSFVQFFCFIWFYSLSSSWICFDNLFFFFWHFLTSLSCFVDYIICIIDTFVNSFLLSLITFFIDFFFFTCYSIVERRAYYVCDCIRS